MGGGFPAFPLWGGGECGGTCPTLVGDVRVDCDSSFPSTFSSKVESLVGVVVAICFVY